MIFTLSDHVHFIAALTHSTRNNYNPHFVRCVPTRNLARCTTFAGFLARCTSVSAPSLAVARSPQYRPRLPTIHARFLRCRYGHDGRSRWRNGNQQHAGRANAAVRPRDGIRSRLSFFPILTQVLWELCADDCSGLVCLDFDNTGLRRRSRRKREGHDEPRQNHRFVDTSPVQSHHICKCILCTGTSPPENGQRWRVALGIPP